MVVYHRFRCYTVGGEPGWGGHKTQAQIVEEDRQAALKELEPRKLHGKLAGYTGNVMYPNEESAVWDVDSKSILVVIQRDCYCLVN